MTEVNINDNRLRVPKTVNQLHIADFFMYKESLCMHGGSCDVTCIGAYDLERKLWFTLEKDTIVQPVSVTITIDSNV